MLCSMGIKKSHSAVSSTSAEAGAVLGEDSCRKDIQDGGVFFMAVSTV